MKKLWRSPVFVAAAFLVFVSFTEARDFKGPDGRVWHRVKSFPESIYQNFLKRPNGIVGPLDIVLRPNQNESAGLVTAEMKGEIAVFYYRGVLRGQGYVLPEEWPKKYTEYILEIRWQDKTGKWHYWWNKEKLNQPLIYRPELYPLAENSLF